MSKALYLIVNPLFMRQGVRAKLLSAQVVAIRLLLQRSTREIPRIFRLSKSHFANPVVG
jgi:hypothetical protein